MGHNVFRDYLNMRPWFRRYGKWVVGLFVAYYIAKTLAGIENLAIGSSLFIAWDPLNDKMREGLGKNSSVTDHEISKIMHQSMIYSHILIYGGLLLFLLLVWMGFRIWWRRNWTGLV